MEPLSNRSDRDSNLPEYNPHPPPTQNDLPMSPDHGKEQPQYQSVSSNYDVHDRHRLPFGWSPALFGLVIALITAIVVGAAVGGGVGGALSSKNNCKAASSASSITTKTILGSLPTTATPTTSITSATSTASALATDYSPLAYSDISSLALDCPALDNQNYSTVWEGQIYTLHCDFLYNDGDIASVFVYSWQDCVEACASVNHYEIKHGGSNTTCNHALFQAEFDSAVTSYNRNCWLKNDGAVVGTPVAEHKLLSANLVAG